MTAQQKAAQIKKQIANREPVVRTTARGIGLLIYPYKQPINLTRKDAGLLRSRIHAVLTARRLARK